MNSKDGQIRIRKVKGSYRHQSCEDDEFVTNAQQTRSLRIFKELFERTRSEGGDVLRIAETYWIVATEKKKRNLSLEVGFKLEAGLKLKEKKLRMICE